MAIQTKQQDPSTFICFADDVDIKRFNAKVFEPKFLLEEGLVERIETGRGSVYFFTHMNVNMVVRKYRRGGLMRFLSKDLFLWKGIKQSRAFAELALLAYLFKNGHSVPRPIAARIARKAIFFYTTEILTEVIPNTKELHKILQEQTVSNAVWKRLGEQIRALHEADVYHPDINVKNVLIDNKEQLFLIDFDKCKIKKGQSWKKANLARFRRSIDKQRNKFNHYHFQECDWQVLLSAYENACRS